MSEQALRLVFPRNDPGGYAIMCGAREVGYAAMVPEEHDGSTWTSWSALLWPVAGCADEDAAEVVTAPRLGDLRALLATRIAERGPWWKVAS